MLVPPSARRFLAVIALVLLVPMTARAALRAIIINDPNDPSIQEATNRVLAKLTARGFAVDQSSSVPANLSDYCCAWELRVFTDLSQTDRNRYLAFLQQGHGLMLLGENTDCCATRDDSIVAFLKQAGGGTVARSATTIPGSFTEDANAGHPVNNVPNKINTISYDGQGAAGFDDLGNGTFLTDEPPQPAHRVAGVWDEGTLTNATGGRVISVLDVNWLTNPTYGMTDNDAFLENIAEFLCPITDGNLTVTITSPATFNKECPATVDVTGDVTGADPECKQPTTFAPLSPAPAPAGTIAPGDADTARPLFTRGEDGKMHPAPAPATPAPGTVAGTPASAPSAWTGTISGAVKAPVAGILATNITKIEYSVNGGPFKPVTSTNPALPAPPPVNFTATGVPVVLGANTITIRATDANGRTATDSVSGTVVDTTPPVIVPPTCADQTVDLGAGCRLDYVGVPTATDTCDPNLTLTSVPPLPITFTGPGSATITYTATDDAGNKATCTRTVTAVDLSGPTITCPAPLTLECTEKTDRPASDPAIVAWLGSATATDNCTANPPVSNDAPAKFPSGCTPGQGTSVTFSSSDASGNKSSCAATLSVQDTTPPGITKTPAPLTLECNAAGGVPRTDARIQTFLADFQADDLCSAATTLGNDAPALFPAGCAGQPTTVTFTATDDCANAATTTSTVTVTDTTAPTLTVPAALTLECNGAGGVARTDAAVQAWLAAATASDLCGSATVTNDAPALLPSGCGAGTTTTVTFTATDGCGNATSKTSTITVKDTTAPTLTVAPPLTLECNGAGGVAKSDLTIQRWLNAALATDTCDGATITDNAPALFPSGCGAGTTTTVTFTAKDNCGNTATATSSITVRDTTAPTLVVPAGITLECNGAGGVARTDAAIVAWLAAATATDVCDGATVTNNAPAVFPSGCGAGTTTTVTFTATDNCGNAKTLTSTVTVKDTTAPTLTAPAAITVECSGAGGTPKTDAAIVAWLASATASDVCDGATIVNNAPALFPSACGAGAATTVTFTATDNCGNVTTKTSTVTVRDTTAPVLTVPAPLTVECKGAGGTPKTDAAIVAWLASATATDVCDGATVTNNAPAVFPSGCGAGTSTTVTFTATDNCGNTTTKTSTVTVKDTTAPTLTVPAPLTLECNGAGGVSKTDPAVVAWLASATASDVCDGATITNNAPALFPSGCGAGTSTTVTFSATDNCGNVTNKTSTVTVRDTIAPTLSVPAPLKLECNGAGGVLRSDPQVQAWLGSATASDVCDGATITDDAPALLPSGCGPGNTTVVTFTAADNCGNKTSRSSSITVADTTPPDLSVPAPITLECTSPGGVPKSDKRIQDWFALVLASDVCDGASLFDDAPLLFPSACAAGAPTKVTFTAKDNCSNTAAKSSTVTVRDTTPPDISACALEPWDPVLKQPRAPRDPASPASCVSSAPFRVKCGTASDACDTQPPKVTAQVIARRHDVVNKACVLVEETIDVACDEVLEMDLLAPPCVTDKPPRSPRPALSITSSGLKVISAEALLLRVTATDSCGNASTPCEVDPAKTPDPTNPPQPLLCPPLPPKGAKCASSDRCVF